MPFPRYKDIIDLLKKGSTVEAQEKIMELREYSIELQEENLQLKEELAALKTSIKTKAEFNFTNGVYFQTVGDKQDGPFCPKCFDVESLTVRLNKSEHLNWGPQWDCKNCESVYSRQNV